VDELAYAAEWKRNLDTLYGGALLRGDRAPGSTPGNTIWPQYVSEHLAPIQVQNALSGTVSPEIRKWRVNAVGRYEVRSGPIRGSSVALTARWQDKIAIGYPLIKDANNQDIADITRPYFGPTTFQVDLNLGYGRKIRLGSRRHDWRISLALGNLIAEDELIPISANIDGSLGVVRIPPARTWAITNSIQF